MSNPPLNYDLTRLLKLPKNTIRATLKLEPDRPPLLTAEIYLTELGHTTIKDFELHETTRPEPPAFDPDACVRAATPSALAMTCLGIR